MVFESAKRPPFQLSAKPGIWVACMAALWFLTRLFLWWQFYPLPWDQHHRISFWAWDGAASYALLATLASGSVWLLIFIEKLRSFPSVVVCFVVTSFTFLALEVNAYALGANPHSGIEAFEHIFGSRIFEIFSDDGILLVLWFSNPLIAIFSGVILRLGLLLESEVSQRRSDRPRDLAV